MDDCEEMLEKEYKPEYMLEEEAFVGIHGFFEERLSFLAGISKPEPWNFNSEKYRANGKKFPILNNYLYFTYDKLKIEGKIAILEDQSAMCFNTGLQTRDFERDIFAYFIKNSWYPDKTNKQWYFQKFCSESDNELTVLRNLPDIPQYWDDPADLIYDKRLNIRFYDSHIVRDNISRFKDVGYDYPETVLQGILESATKKAEKRVRRNYKLAIPQFYTDKTTKQSKIQLLLPLCLGNSTEADLALVISREGETYLAKTILPLDWAYMNSRRIITPDADWIRKISCIETPNQV